MTTGSQGRLHESREAQPPSIAPLRRAVVAFARTSGASELLCEDIALAVTVVVDASVLHRALQVVVCDEGAGTLPRDDDAGVGFALGIIVRLADSVEIEETAPGVRLRMTFTLDPGQPADESALRGAL